MLSLVARRLLLLIPLLLGVTLLTFVVSRVLPGDPARILAGVQATEEQVEGLRSTFGLDRPLPAQYLSYLDDLSEGDLGTSLRTNLPVTSDLSARAPATLELITAALAFALIVAIPLGVWAATRPQGIVDRSTRVFTTFGIAVPDFWLGLLLIFLFFVILGWAPAPVGRLDIITIPPDGPTGFMTIDTLLAGDFSTFADAVGHLILPALALGIPAIAPLLRLTKNSTITVLQSDYVTFARASGLKGLQLNLKYVLRNALPPTVTMTGLIFGYLIGGAVLVETIFAWPGIGLYAVNSIHFNDYAAIQGFVLVAAVVYLLVFTVIDVINAALDPRLRPT